MIQASERAGLVQGHQVAGLLHYAQQRAIAARIEADRALLGFGQVEAHPAVAHVFLDVANRVGQGQRLGLVDAQHVIR